LLEDRAKYLKELLVVDQHILLCPSYGFVQDAEGFEECIFILLRRNEY
jgi:hypothetical protein